MSVYTYILVSTLIFIFIIYILVAMLLGVKSKLLPSGPVKILINGEKEIEVSSGSTLLSTLGDNKVFYHRLVVVEVHAFNVSVLLMMVVEKSYPPKNLISLEKK